MEQPGSPQRRRPYGTDTSAPPFTYLPCRLDSQGALAEVLRVSLDDGRVALAAYSALDRFARHCGDGHPWVVWWSDELDLLRAEQPFDVAYLDAPLPEFMRIDGGDRG